MVEKSQMPYSILQNFMAAVASVVYVIIQKYQMAVLQEERLWLEKDKLEAYFAWLETKMEKQSEPEVAVRQGHPIYHSSP